MKISFTLFLLIFSLKTFSNETIKVAFFDTTFCSKNITTASNIFIHPTVSYEKDYEDCPQKGHSRISHGNEVLKTFLRSFKSNSSSLEIFPISVFDKKGSTHLNFWENALSFIKDKNVSLLILATGLINQTPKNPYQGYIFAASPTKGRGITEKDFIWPASIDSKLVVLFGTYHKTVPPNGTIKNFKNRALLYPKKAQYLISDLKFFSSSLAAAHLSGVILSHCFVNSELKSCMKTALKDITTYNYEVK